MITILTKGHFCAELDVESSSLEDVELRITMCPLETCESLLESDGGDLMKEYAALRVMVTEYINHLYELREGGLSYAV